MSAGTIASGVLAALLAACSASTTPSDGGSSDAGGTGCADACGTARACCGSACVNPQNDPQNCGSCGTHCSADTYCTGGACVARPCTTTCGSGALCCGRSCCAAGQLCCDPEGPLSMGPVCTDPTPSGSCPQGCAPLCVCASPDTPIATPFGDREIASLSVGDLVYSEQADAIVVVPIVATRRTPVTGHTVIHVVLETGASFDISARHPTADGRWVGDLSAGDQLSSTEIVGAWPIPYAHDATYDILPGSSSGTYFVAGVPMGSTITPE